MQHLQGNSCGTNIGSVFVEEKNLFFQRGLAPPKQALSMAFAVPPSRCTLFPGLKSFSGGESKERRRDRSAQFNPAICSSRLELPRHPCLPRRKTALLQTASSPEASGLETPAGESRRNGA